jgi:hypothetical protein
MALGHLRKEAFVLVAEGIQGDSANRLAAGRLDPATGCSFSS